MKAGRAQCPGCSSSVAVDLDADEGQCPTCRRTFSTAPARAKALELLKGKRRATIARLMQKREAAERVDEDRDDTEDDWE